MDDLKYIILFFTIMICIIAIGGVGFDIYQKHTKQKIIIEMIQHNKTQKEIIEILEKI